MEKLDIETISRLEQAINENIPMLIIFNYINKELNINNIENGIYDLSKKILADVIEKQYFKSQKHLCWNNCLNATPNNCPKIKNERKRTINNYEFITDGYQIINDDKLIKFVVSKCKKYKKQD